MSDLTADSVVRLRAEYVVDKYGNESSDRDWGAAARTPISGVALQPDGTLNSLEGVGDRAPITTGWRMFSRRGVDLDVLATDRFEFDGMTLEVDGEVGRWRRAGTVHHVELRLKRVTG